MGSASLEQTEEATTMRRSQSLDAQVARSSLSLLILCLKLDLSL
jgi:hypothetical protein